MAHFDAHFYLKKSPFAPEPWTGSLSPKEQLEVLTRGCQELLPEGDLLLKLEKSASTGQALKVKLGCDPTRADLHLGHTVVLVKLRQFQDLGHWVDFVIGDFTARIGDPSGRQKTRPALNFEEIESFAKTYEEQVFKVLDPKRTRVHKNSTWLELLGMDGVLKILSTVTLTQLLSREDFTRRFKSEVPIGMHEFMYPLLQGLDSLALGSDVELGGNDQKFNLLMGRHLQRMQYNWCPKEIANKEQSILLMPLLEGLDGVEKMSKSLDNAICLTESPTQQFGKIMSISDPLMMRYYELLSFKSLETLEQLKLDLETQKVHPMAAKKALACELVDRFHSCGAAEQARFEQRFSKREELNLQELPVFEFTGSYLDLDLTQFLCEHKIVSSKSEVRRLLSQKAIRFNDLILSDLKLTLQGPQEGLLKIGKLRRICIKLLI